MEHKLSVILKGISRTSTKDIGISLAATLLAFIIGTIFILVIGESPMKAFGALIEGSLGSDLAIANTISKTVVFIFTGLAVAIASRSGMLNIGAEGQLHLGAMAAVLFALAFPDMNVFLLMPLVFLVGIAGGAFAGSIMGVFRAKLGTSEVIVGIMLNYTLILFTSYLVNGPFKSEGTVAQTEKVSEAARLATIIPRSQLTTALYIAIIVSILIYILLWKTNLGFKIRSVGINLSSSEAAGINPRSSMIIAMIISGGVAALAGITEVLGKYDRFIEGFSPDYGFVGIAIAVLGRNHPIGIALAALLFGILETGALRMDRMTMVSNDMITVIQSLVILFVAAPEIIKVFSMRRGI